MNPHKPIPTPWTQRLRDLRHGPLTLVVWLAAIGAVGWILHHRSGRFEYIGLAQALQYEISASVAGHLARVEVDLFQPIQAGEVVARLDDAQLAAQTREAQSAAARLRAELDALQQRWQSEGLTLTSDRQADLRRFQAEEEQRRVEALALKVQLESDRVEEQRLSLELGRFRPLLAAEIIDRSTFDNLRLQHETVVARLRDNGELLGQIESLRQASRQRREEFAARAAAATTIDVQLQPIAEAIQEQEAVVEALRVQREGSTLRAPVSGLVSQVLCRVGQAVVPGEPIMMVTERRSAQVVFYLSEAEANRLGESARVLLARATDPGRVAESFVERVGPAIELMPARLWTNPALPQYGRPVSIAVAPALDILPGETVRVRLPGTP
jgi:multidrug resistance efflux pump